MGEPASGDTGEATTGSFPFWTTYRVRIGDINYGGHMGNDRFLLLFQEARIRYLQSLGFSEASIGDDVGVILTEAHVHYRAEAFHGDVLEAGVRVTDVKKSSFAVDFLVRKESGHAVVATGRTVMAAFDYGRRRVARIPRAFTERLAGGRSEAGKGEAAR